MERQDLHPDVYQDLGHTQTPRICHTFVLSLLVSGSLLHPKCLFFLANVRLPNCPGCAPTWNLFRVTFEALRRPAWGRFSSFRALDHSFWSQALDPAGLVTLIWHRPSLQEDINTAHNQACFSSAA